MLGRNDTVEIACKLMVGIRVIARVCHYMASTSALEYRPQHRAELVDVGPRVTSGDGREDQMAGGITGQSQFWEATVGDILDLLGVAYLR
jgi:hypothetical protein